MKYFIGILFTLGILLLTFLGLNQLWNWVNLHQASISGSVLTSVILVASIIVLYCTWYIFFRKNNRYPVVGDRNSNHKIDSE